MVKCFTRTKRIILYIVHTDQKVFADVSPQYLRARSETRKKKL